MGIVQLDMYTNAAGIHAIPLAEHSLLAMLYFTKNVPLSVRSKLPTFGSGIVPFVPALARGILAVIYSCSNIMIYIVAQSKRKA